MNDNINKIKYLINESDCILIGAGSGLSTSAGIKYSGEEFEKEFKPFIDKYSFSDLYTASFYDFKLEEEKWAFLQNSSSLLIQD